MRDVAADVGYAVYVVKLCFYSDSRAKNCVFLYWLSEIKNGIDDGGELSDVH